LSREDPPLFSSFEQGESSRVRSVVIGSLSLPSESAHAAVTDLADIVLPSLHVLDGAILFLPNSGSFHGLIRFLNDKIYKKVICLPCNASGAVFPVDSATMLASIFESVTAKVWKGLLMNILSPHSILDYARALEIKRVLTPPVDNRPSPFANLFLNEIGELDWIPFHLMGYELGLG
jgi:hypothetical protein